MKNKNSVELEEWKHNQLQKWYSSGRTICIWCSYKLVKAREGLVCKNWPCPFHFKVSTGWVYRDEGARFRKWNVRRESLTQSKKFEILRRDNYTCKKCCRVADYNLSMHVDHIIPLSKGGDNSEENLQTLCVDCNLSKGNMLEVINPELPLEAHFVQNPKSSFKYSPVETEVSASSNSNLTHQKFPMEKKEEKGF